MERLTTMEAVSLPVANEVDRAWSIPWSRLFPLWRHGLWLAAIFAVMSASVWVRLDVQRLQMDLDRNDRLQRNALMVNDRLRLELDARRRLALMERYAAAIGVDGEAPIIRMEIH